MGRKLQTKHEIYIIKVFSHEKTSLFGIFTYFYGVYHMQVCACCAQLDTRLYIQEILLYPWLP